MPIKNKGNYNLTDVFKLEVANDWPTAQVTYTSDVVESSGNLYFTGARAVSAVTNTTLSNVTTGSLKTGTLTVDTGTYGNVTITQFAGVFGQAAGPNPYSIMQVRSNDGTTGLGMQVYAGLPGLLYSSGNIVLNTGATVRDKDFPTGGTIGTAFSPLGITTTGGIYASADVVAAGNLIANGLVIRNIVVTDPILLGQTTANTVTLNNITANVWNGIYTANVIETPGNLYYTNARARSAFSAGRGIIIQEDGLLKTTVGSDLYSSSIDGLQDYFVTDTMSTALTFPSVPTTDRFVVRSIHVTNISDNHAYISANVVYATGNIAMLATQIPVPLGSLIEFMGDKTQVFAPGDIIKLQGFDQTMTPAASKLSAYMTFETIPSDPTYYGVGETLATSNNNILIADMTQSASIVESIKFVNHKATAVPVRLTITSANNTPKAYWAYNQLVPPQSSLEILQAPKLLRSGDRLFARYDNASNIDSVSVFTSYRLGSVSNYVSGPGPLVSGNSGTVSFSTSIPDGTTLYYTLE